MRTRLFRLAALVSIFFGAIAAHAQTPTVFTVTNTQASGPGSLAGVLAQQFASCPASSRIEFNIPMSDPNCNAGTGVCVIQAPDLVAMRCSNTVLDGYTQPGASPNSSVGADNNAQIKIELDNASGNNKVFKVVGDGELNFTANPIFNVTIRGLALPRHGIELWPSHSGSVYGVGGGHRVSGVWLGWHADGTAVEDLPAARGIQFWGNFVTGFTIGGPDPADRNLLTFPNVCCGSDTVGIRTFGSQSVVIENNYFHVGPDGQVRATVGIASAIFVTFDGLMRDAIIRNNVMRMSANGSPVFLGFGAGITMSRNVIFGQAPAQPAWGFVQPSEGGANTQVAPVITGVTELPNEVKVYGTVTGGANRTQRLEFFHNSQYIPPPGSAAERFVGQLDVTLDASGNGTFIATLPADARNIKVSATDLTTGETSKLNVAEAPPNVFALNLNKAGAGGGTVSVGNPVVAQCTGACTVPLAKDSVVTLTAAPDAGSQFDGWSGECSGTGTCTVTMSATRNVTANYGISGQVTFTVTNTNAGGAGSLVGVLAQQAAACPQSSRIVFNIPAATDPNCTPGTGICRIQAPDVVNMACNNTVLDGYTQPGAVPNSSVDRATNAQLKIELVAANSSSAKTLEAHGGFNGNGFNGAFNVTIRGLALPHHQIALRPGNTGSVLFGGGGHVVAGNWFGWHADGTQANATVGSRGLLMYGAFMSGVRVGGPDPADRNLLTYRNHAACCEVASQGITGFGVQNVLIENNHVNVSPAGNPVATNGVFGGVNLTAANGNNTPYSRNSIIRNNVLLNLMGGIGMGLGEGITVSRNVVAGLGPALPAWSYFSIAGGGVRDPNPPVITGVTQLAGEVRVFGTVVGSANATMRLEFFHNTNDNFGGGSQAERFIGEFDVVLDANGNGTFAVSLPPDSRNIAASATNLAKGETSYLSGNSGPQRQVYRLDISRSGSGLGTVSVGNPSAFDCAGSCLRLADKDSVVTLFATPQAGSVFTGWSGDCSGTGSCTLTMSGDRNVVANYSGGSGPPVIVGAALSADVTSGVPFSFTYQVSGATPFTWSLEPDCTLPAGLSLDATTGTIAGTPSALSERIECAVRVTNGQQPDAVQAYDLRANVTAGTPQFTGNTMPGGTTGVAYSQGVPVQGTAPLAMTVLSGALPPGLSFTGAVLGGTPTADGSYTFLLRASGPEGTATRRFTMTVGLGVAPQITSSLPTGGLEFVAYSHTFVATGTAPIAWSVASGDLPPGFSLDAATGVLSGTTTASGSYSFVIQATNGTAPPATQPVTLVIGANSRSVTVTRTGTGTGRVVSTPAGIDCGSTCTARFLFGSGSQVALTATPDADSEFDGWSNACTGTAACNLTMSTNRTVNARFVKRQVTLAVTKTNGGSVTSNPGVISCGSTCQAQVDVGSTFTLFANASIGFRFAGWSGACSGTATQCVVTMDDAKTVNATFIRQRTLTVTTAGAGPGLVTSSPDAIQCGLGQTACTATFDEGTQVGLGATSVGGQSVFAGWSGACTGTGACSVTMNADAAVSATFNPPQAATQRLTVNLTGASGSVRVGTGSNMLCVVSGPCTFDLPTGTTVPVSFLDVGYFTFLGWSGDCSGTQPSCNLTMDGPRTVTASFGSKQVVVTVVKTGNGSGRVTASGGAIDCGATCQDTVAASPVFNLQAIADAGSTFTGWTNSGCQDPSSATCRVDLKQNTTITANFMRPVVLTVNVAGPMPVTSEPPGLVCRQVTPNSTATTCTGAFPIDTTITLTAPRPVAGWAGCNSTSGSTCTVTLQTLNDRTVQVTPSGELAILNVRKPHGVGDVSLALQGSAQYAACEGARTQCSTFAYLDSTVVFTATPSPGHVMLGWIVQGPFTPYLFVNAGCTPSTAQCVLPLTDPGFRALLREFVPIEVIALIVRTPATIAGVATSSAPALSRTARIGASFSPAPQVLLRDANGQPVSGAVVTFQVIPGPNGATGVKGGSPMVLTTENQRTGADGIASMAVSANGIVGPWTLRATPSAPAGLAPVNIAMNNTNDVTPITLPGTGRVTIPTSSAVGARLSVLVKLPNGTPVSGAQVRFAAPVVPPGVGGVASGTLTPPQVTTGSSGIARTLLRSNGVNGTFSVTVTVTLPPGVSLNGAQRGKAGEEYEQELTVQTIEMEGNLLADDPMGDYDADGIPNAVEDTEGTLILDMDNDVFGNARLFAMQQYRDFLGREGEEGGIQFYENLVGNGTGREQVIASFLASPEFSSGLPAITRLYFSFFGRIPDYDGLLFQVTALRQGTPLELIAQNFYNSPEFTSRYGALSNDDYINLVYQNVLGRVPDAGGFAFYKNLLDSNAITKGQMMIGFSESPEFQQKTDDRAWVVSVYLGLLRRTPEEAGLDFYANLLSQGAARTSVIPGFFNSPEYRGRFLP